MPCVVTDVCLDCTRRDCLAVCPIDCIFDAEDGRRVVIHPDECFECLCCYLACPREGAIEAASALPPDKKEWEAINARISTAPGAKRLAAVPLPVASARSVYGRCAGTAYLGEVRPKKPKKGVRCSSSASAPKPRSRCAEDASSAPLSLGEFSYGQAP